MTTAIATMPDASAIEQVLINGDLSRLTPAQRVSYYNQVCHSLGLNPLTKPFAYLKLNGKDVLYALRDAAEQLRKLHGVSITDMQTQRFEDCYVVTVKAQDKTGRTDMSTGAVPLGQLRGEALANALLKAETKAKRRVTLSICGLGMLDETEVAAIQEPTGYQVPAPATVVDTQTGAEVAATERPTPPSGFAYLDACESRNGWTNLQWQGQEYKTKLAQIGSLAEQAFQQGVPVKLHSKKLPWLDKVETYKHAPRIDESEFDDPAPLKATDIAF